MTYEQEVLDLEWDLIDRDSRVLSGELLEDVDDPTVVVVTEDE